MNLLLQTKISSKISNTNLPEQPSDHTGKRFNTYYTKVVKMIKPVTSVASQVFFIKTTIRKLGIENPGSIKIKEETKKMWILQYE